METNRTAPLSYNLPRDCADDRYYVVDPGGDCVGTSPTKEGAESLAAGYAADAQPGMADGYIVIDTQGRG